MYMKDIFLQLLILFFIIVFILYFIHFFKAKQEGFDVSDVDKVVNKIDSVVNMAGEIPKKIDNISSSLENKLKDGMNSAKNEIEGKMITQINQLGTQIERNMTSQINNLGNEIKKNTLDLITEKFTSIFKQLETVFDEGLIKPFASLFEGIGNIFIQIFNILKMIGNKIASLPSCSIVYGIKTTIDIMYSIYAGIMPSFLRSFFDTLYDYTFGIIFSFIGYITGYSDAVKRCYGFNVNDEIDKMNENAKEIQRAFVKGWKLDFTKIKI